MYIANRCDGASFEAHECLDRNSSGCLQGPALACAASGAGSCRAPSAEGAWPQKQKKKCLNSAEYHL